MPESGARSMAQHIMSTGKSSSYCVSVVGTELTLGRWISDPVLSSSAASPQPVGSKFKKYLFLGKVFSDFDRLAIYNALGGMTDDAIMS